MQALNSEPRAQDHFKTYLHQSKKRFYDLRLKSHGPHDPIQDGLTTKKKKMKCLKHRFEKSLTWKMYSEKK